MENFYEQMTYIAVYDGHGQHGKSASELANTSIKEALEQKKEELAKMGYDEVPDFFVKSFLRIQEKYKADVRTRPPRIEIDVRPQRNLLRWSTDH